MLDFKTSLVVLENHGSKSYLGVVNGTENPDFIAAFGQNVATLILHDDESKTSTELAKQDFSTYEEAASFLNAECRKHRHENT